MYKYGSEGYYMPQTHESRPRLETYPDYNATITPDALSAVARPQGADRTCPRLQSIPLPFLLLKF